MTDPADNNAAFISALRRGDVAAAADSYMDDALLVPPSTGIIRGRAAIAEYWRAGVDAGMDDVAFNPVELRNQDGISFEIGRYLLALTATDGSRVTDQGEYVVVHQRQPDGSWRFAVEMLSADTRPAR